MEEDTSTVPCLNILSLPTDAILHTLGFLYPYDQNRCCFKNGYHILNVIANHNDMHALYKAFPTLRRFIRQLAHEQGYWEALGLTKDGDRMNIDDDIHHKRHNPFLHRLRLIQDADVTTYQCSGETRGETGREGIANLLREGDAEWNKWYDPTLRLDVSPFYAQISLRRPVHVLAYGIKTANDHPARDPKDWNLWVSDRHRRDLIYRPYSKLHIVHRVTNHRFTRRYETAWWTIPPTPPAKQALTIRLAIDATRNDDSSGAQIGQLYLVVADD